MPGEQKSMKLVNFDELGKNEEFFEGYWRFSLENHQIDHGRQPGSPPTPSRFRISGSRATVTVKIMKPTLTFLSTLLLAPLAAFHADITQSDGDSMTEVRMEPQLPCRMNYFSRTG